MPSSCQEHDRDLTTLTTWLKVQLGAPVSLVWTNNRTSIISAKRRPGTGYQLRVHQMFKHAPKSILQALVAYVSGNEGASENALRHYIKEQQHLIQKTPTRRVLRLATQGRYFDLQQLYQELNQLFFAHCVQADITWSRQAPQRQRMSIRFGSYDSQQLLIRIHPHLDQAFVPQYFIESVIFHEMLHQLIPRRRINGRWSIHPPEFYQAERHFPQYEKAVKWQQQNLFRLLSG